MGHRQKFPSKEKGYLGALVKEKYEADNKDELKDNILFLFEQVRADSFYNLSEADECLRDILKNYHANVILDFIDS